MRSLKFYRLEGYFQFNMNHESNTHRPNVFGNDLCCFQLTNQFKDCHKTILLQHFTYFQLLD
jgi:hypothetical protein